MKKIAILTTIHLLLQFGLKGQVCSTVMSSSSTIDTGYYVFNHGSEIIKLKAGSVLPNGDTLMQDRLIVSGFGTFLEGFPDQEIWMSQSNNGGSSWSPALRWNQLKDSGGDTLVWNAAEYVDSNSLITKFFLQQPTKSGGSGGASPLWLKYRQSQDGGTTWSSSKYADLYGNLDSNTVKLSSIFSFVPLRGDTIGASTYIRWTGNRTAYYGFLKFTEDLSYFQLDTFSTYALTHPDRRIEPYSTWFDNKIYTFFRSSGGVIEYIFSNDYGKSWSNIHRTKIPHSSTKSAMFTEGGRLYAIVNYNIQDRNNLVLLELNTSIEVTGYWPIASFQNDEEYQVSYPSVALDGKEVNISYSRVWYDATHYTRRSSIEYCRIHLDSIQAVSNRANALKVPSKSTSARTYFYNSDAQIGSLSAFTERRGRIQTFSNNQWQGTSLNDTTILYSSVLAWKSDTLLVAHSSGGLMIYNQGQNHSALNFVNANSDLIRCDRDFFVGTEQNSIALYNQNGLINKIFLPFNAPFTFWRLLFTDVSSVYVRSVDSIYFADVQGNLFLSTDSLKSYTTVVAKGLPRDPRIYPITTDTWMVTSHDGALYEFDLLTMGLRSIAIPHKNPHQFTDVTFHGNHIYFLSGGTIYRSDSALTSLDTLFLDQTGVEFYKFIDSSSTSLTIVDVFGDVYELDVSSGIGLPERKSILTRIYPNPTSDEMFIDMNGIFDVYLYSLNGEQVGEFHNCTRHLGINTGNLTSGVYMVSIQKNGEVLRSTKVIVVK